MLDIVEVIASRINLELPTVDSDLDDVVEFFFEGRVYQLEIELHYIDYDYDDISFHRQVAVHHCRIGLWDKRRGDLTEARNIQPHLLEEKLEF